MLFVISYQNHRNSYFFFLMWSEIHYLLVQHPIECKYDYKNNYFIFKHFFTYTVSSVFTVHFYKLALKEMKNNLNNLKNELFE